MMRPRRPDYVPVNARYVNPHGRKPAGYYLLRFLLAGVALGVAIGSILALLYAIL